MNGYGPKNKRDTTEVVKEEPATEDVEEKSPEIKPSRALNKEEEEIVNEQDQEDIINDMDGD